MLITKTTMPATRKRWIRLPPKLRLKPRSHRIKKRATIVQSIIPSGAQLRAPCSKICPPVRPDSGRHDQRCLDLVPGRFPFAIRSLLADYAERSPWDCGKALRIDGLFASDADSKGIRINAAQRG